MISNYFAEVETNMEMQYSGDLNMSVKQMLGLKIEQQKIAAKQKKLKLNLNNKQIM